MPEENKDIEDLLKKFKQFTGSQIPPFFQTKPQYISVLEKELQNPTLKIGEYTEIPFNPINETFSKAVVEYFLAKDGLINKYVKYIFCTSSSYAIIDIHLQTGEYLSLIQLNKLSVMLIRSESDLVDIMNVAVHDFDKSLESIYKKKGQEVSIERDIIGIEVYALNVDVETRYLVSDVIQNPFKESTITIESSLTNKAYSIKGYSANGKMGELLIIPEYQILDYYERVLKDYFKKV